MSPDLHLVACDEQRHGPAILAILNDAILHTTALWDYVPLPPDSMPEWFRAKQSGNYPVVGAVDEHGALLGFATYGPFRHRPAYKYSVEHSVYVHRDHRGRKVGERLLREIILRAQAQDYHLMVGGIATENTASIALHERVGFQHAGTIREAGFKFGRWLDLSFYELLLPTPHRPSDG